MKILVWSDLHAHCFATYSTILKDGTNSRLQDAINAINEIRELATTLGADMVLFGGDLFHERRHVVTQAFTKVYEALSMFSVDKMPLFLIHGNHDQADKLGRFHALSPFSSFATVVDEPGWTEFEGKSGAISILAVPYIENSAHLHEVVSTAPTGVDPTLTKIFLGHLGLRGAKLGADFVYSNGLEPSIEDIPTESFDAGFLGHFHVHQPVATNFWYVGAPMQHNWGDVGQERGVMFYDTETNVASHIPLTTAPRFVESTIGDLERNEGDWEGNFVRIISDKPWSEDQVDSTCERIGASSLEVFSKKAAVEDAFEARIQLDPGASYEELVAEYVKSGLVDLEGLEEDWLVKVARGILSEVSS